MSQGPNWLPSVSAAERRYFIGGCDARTIMGDDEAAHYASGARSVARSSPRTCPATSSFSSG